MAIFGVTPQDVNLSMAQADIITFLLTFGQKVCAKQKDSSTGIKFVICYLQLEKVCCFNKDSNEFFFATWQPSFSFVANMETWVQ